MDAICPTSRARRAQSQSASSAKLYVVSSTRSNVTQALDAKKAGRTPLDEVGRWWHKLRDKPALLVHIDAAQLVPASVLAELIYIIGYVSCECQDGTDE